jgi:hypothetical protein
MLIDDVADQIALAADPDELDEIVKGMWGHHFAGAVTVDEAEVLDEAARTRREAFQERWQAARLARRPGNAPWGRARKRQRSPDRPRLNGAAASSHPARCRHPWPPDSHGASKP